MNSREIYKQIILIENELNNLFIEAQIGERKHERRPDLREPKKIEDMLKRFRDKESLTSIANNEVYKTNSHTIKSILLDPSGGNMSPEEFDELVQKHRRNELRLDLREPKKIADMLKRFRDGESLNSIANDEVYKTNDDTIRRILLHPNGGKMSKEEFKRLIQQHKDELRPDLWETEKIEDMLKRFRGGESIYSIANDEVYKTSNRTIKRILLHPNGGKMSKEEFKRLKQQHRRNEFRLDLREPKNIEDMLRAFRRGESLRSIAKIYHTNTDTLTRILLDPHNSNKPPMSREEYNEILSRRSMGSRIRSRPKGSRLTPEDSNADPANTYSSRATGDDPVLSGPIRDPIAEAVEEVIKLHFST